MRTLARDVSKNVDQEITIEGWLHKKRLLGGMTFILVRDRSGVTQILIEDKVEVKKLIGLQNGTVLSVTGKVTEDDRAPGGAEMHDPKLEIIVPVEAVPAIEVDKPIDHKSENHNTLFENRVLNLRNLTEQGIFKVQAEICKSVRKYFEDNEFTEIHTPKLLAEATEGGADVFTLDYFGKEATLAQSPQFYKQMLVGVFERVYEIAPVYRAELSSTTRHMSEYISIDGEMGFVTLRDLMDFLSGMVNQVVDDTWKNQEGALSKLQAHRPKLTEKFPIITLSDLHVLYTKETGEDTTGEKDPTPAEERWASEFAKKKYGSEAIFISEFPASDIKFYHKIDEQKPEVAARFDLIFRGVEIVTASLRENKHDTVIKQLKDMGGDPAHPGYKHLLGAMEAGMPPHGGFGMGLERLTEKIVGLDNVKEATLFPRDLNRLTP